MILAGGGDYPHGSGIIQAKDLFRNSVNRLLLNPDGGYVGIGKTSPTCSLDVSGNGNISGSLSVNSLSAGSLSLSSLNVSTINSLSTLNLNNTDVNGNMFLHGYSVVGEDVDITSRGVFITGRPKNKSAMFSRYQHIHRLDSVTNG